VVTTADQAATIIWSKMYGCYDHFPEASSFTARPDGPTRWIVEGRSADTVYGLWYVDGNDGDFRPADQVAEQVKQDCIPTPVVLTPEHAAIIVWSEMYGCYGHFPQASSFTATPDGPTRWIVEGRSADTVYGLWSVDVMTGNITPSDQVAEQVKEKCIPTPVVLTAEQAALRVWQATYACFPTSDSPTRLGFSVFSGHQADPQWWIVDGRDDSDPENIETYGLWLVDTDTGNVQPWDSLAVQTAGLTCFRQP